jgi:nitrate reductase molybdenum cofactor assembly chaperone NarJ/NarW
VIDWKLLSLELQYPDEELLALGAELPTWMRATPLSDLQALYVRTFDFDRRATLHLTYHTHGDRRQRGLELVRLKRRYAEADLPLTGDELPDYLPVLLEFAALSPVHGEPLLAEFRVSIELVRSRLHQTESPYAGVLDAVASALPRPTRAQVAAARKLAEEGPPTELVGLEPFAAEVAS